MSARLPRLAAAALALHGGALSWAQETGASAAPPTAPAAAIVLLLPLDSPDFRAVAGAVRAGVAAAAGVSAGALPVVVRATDADPARVVAEYEAAAEAGARVVIGPMTRAEVGALAASGKTRVPTVALNQPEGRMVLPDAFYVFGLSVEGETRHVARLAARDGLRTATVVSSTSALAKRSREAFVAEWQAQGGRIADVFEVQPGADPSLLRRSLARNPPALVFLAAEGEAARALRLALGNAYPVFATSQINSAPADRLRSFDLAGVTFADMPWIVQPDHPANAGIARPALDGDAARFYALGIDAFRIAAALAAGERSFDLDGVTGRVSVSASGLVQRRPLAATFRDGQCVALE